MAGCCVDGNQLSGSIKCREFLDQLKNYQLMKKVSVPQITWLISQLVGRLVT